MLPPLRRLPNQTDHVVKRKRPRSWKLRGRLRRHNHPGHLRSRRWWIGFSKSTWKLASVTVPGAPRGPRKEDPTMHSPCPAEVRPHPRSPIVRNARRPFAPAPSAGTVPASRCRPGRSARLTGAVSEPGRHLHPGCFPRPVLVGPEPSPLGLPDRPSCSRPASCARPHGGPGPRRPANAGACRLP